MTQTTEDTTTLYCIGRSMYPQAMNELASALNDRGIKANCYAIERVANLGTTTEPDFQTHVGIFEIEESSEDAGAWKVREALDRIVVETFHDGNVGLRRQLGDFSPPHKTLFYQRIGNACRALIPRQFSHR